MDFAYSDKVKALQEKVLRFMDDHIYPNEQRFHDEVEANTRKGQRWTPTRIIEELERRLRARNTESEEALARRLATARRELAQKDRYRYEVINRDVQQAVREVCEILLRYAER